MTSLLEHGYMETFLLIFIRVLGMFMMIPFFGNQNVPRRVKVLLSFFIAVIMMQIMPLQAPVTADRPLAYGLAVITEFFIGWLLGFGVYLVYSVLTMAGQFVDVQIGLSMVSVINPLSQMQFTVTGNLYYFVLLFIMIMTRTYYYFLEGLKQSYRLIPLGKVQIGYKLYDSLFIFLRDYFLMALQIALLVFFVMLITNAVLGILARTAPQLNMFVVGFPIKLILGLVTIYITFFVFEGLSDMVIDRGGQLMHDFIRGMSGR
ncbi:flagellar biosynthetic protein FliR [Clostridiales bacterium COT073_COT-073]|nr:flagellar biosynthetic protein FliR [Clostridiales bacterium COT073_COT-073]